MPKRRDLPPPPKNPELSPPVAVAGEEEIVLSGLDGQPSLEARIRAPLGATHAVVLCHPHPRYGGTMHSAVVLAVTKVLVERGGDRVATLRFNFRGMGKSEGAFENGMGETMDARAAIRVLRERSPGAKMAVCGYSFGTWVGLRAAAAEGNVDRVVLVAPAVRIFEFVKADGALFQGRLSILVGDQDEYCDVEEAEALATTLGASLQVLEGADHYFLKSRRKVAEAVTSILMS